MRSSSAALREITVVAAVIRDEGGRILITRRPQGVHMGGLWEFPGGKVAAGEAPAAALVRELREELGLEAAVGAPLSFAVHEEPGLRILLLFFAARIVAGEPVPAEGQAVRWVSPAELAEHPTPPADAELVARITAGTLP